MSDALQIGMASAFAAGLDRFDQRLAAWKRGLRDGENGFCNPPPDHTAEDYVDGNLRGLMIRLILQQGTRSDV